MKFTDYYQVLGVSEAASQDEIKRAYRKKARQYHPDVSDEKDAEEKFKAVNEAHEVLRDEKRRAEYDQLKRAGFNSGDDFDPRSYGGGFGGGPGGQGGFGGADADFSDFFNTIFGQGFNRTGGDPFGGAQRSASGSYNRTGTRGRHSLGDDIKLSVRVSLENARRGGKTKIKIPAAHGYPEKSLNVNIPAGVVDAQKLRIRGQGRPGARAGDLLLTIRLKPHQQFDVEGSNIILQLPVSPLESIEGATIDVPTLDGKVSLKIPAGTKSGTKLRLKGRGLAVKPAGDQIVVVQIALPDVVSESDRAALVALEAGWNPRTD